MGAFKDLTGKVFGDWTVLERAENNKHRGAMWVCRCECGTKREVSSNLLRQRRSTSCGHWRSIDLTGWVFGKWTVIEQAPSDKLGKKMWWCRCSCGTKKAVNGWYLREKRSTSCGHRVERGSLNKAGYRRLSRPGHPNADRSGKIFEHRLVMSQELRRPLFPGENVHHRNGVRDDNRPENLELSVTMPRPGQRPEDLVAWAREVLDRYEPVEARRALVLAG